MKKEHKIYWTALVLLTLAFIWGNSLLPAHTSQAISNTVQRTLAIFIPSSSPDGGPAAPIWRVIVRKAAHFFEFFVLGWLLCVRFDGAAKKLWPVFLAALLAALADETVQYFTARGSSVLDVWLDFTGAVAGTGTTLLLTRKKRSGAHDRKRRAEIEDGDRV